MKFFNKKKKDTRCNHKFKDFNAIVIVNRIRMVSCCELCGLAIHRQIYSMKKAAELENE